MVGLAGIPPFGGGGVNIRPNIEPAAAAAVPLVEASVAGQALSGRMSSGQSQTDSGAGHPSGQPVEQKRVDLNEVPGPPPTFQISLLELDHNLAETLARINAAHAIARDAGAIASRSPKTDSVQIAQPDAREAKGQPDAAEPAQATPPGESALKGYSAA